jgi:hypothetical protein
MVLRLSCLKIVSRALTEMVKQLSRLKPGREKSATLNAPADSHFAWVWILTVLAVKPAQSEWIPRTGITIACGFPACLRHQAWAANASKHFA